jgi:hypothetical protein
MKIKWKEKNLKKKVDQFDSNSYALPVFASIVIARADLSQPQFCGLDISLPYERVAIQNTVHSSFPAASQGIYKNDTVAQHSLYFVLSGAYDAGVTNKCICVSYHTFGNKLLRIWHKSVRFFCVKYRLLAFKILHSVNSASNLSILNSA